MQILTSERISVTKLSNGLVVRMPVEDKRVKTVFLFIYFTFFVIAILFVMVADIFSETSTPEYRAIGVVSVLVIIALYLVAMLRGALWNFCGYEEITFTPHTITIEYKGTFFAGANVYTTDHIANVRIDDDERNSVRWGSNRGFNVPGGDGIIHFRCKHRKVNFASGLTVAEAMQLLAMLRREKLLIDSNFFTES
jgi:hypothetical protein